MQKMLARVAAEGYTIPRNQTRKETAMHTMHDFTVFAEKLTTGELAIAAEALRTLAERKAQETEGTILFQRGMKVYPAVDWRQVAEALEEVREHIAEIAAAENADLTPPIIGRKDD